MKLSRIVPISYKKYQRFLEEIGCTFSRQRGDHLIYWRDDLKRPVVFQKKGEVPVAHIRNNLRTLKMTPQQYLEILDNV